MTRAFNGCGGPRRRTNTAQELVVAGQPAAEDPLDPDMPSGREEGTSLAVAGKLQETGLAVALDATPFAPPTETRQAEPA